MTLHARLIDKFGDNGIICVVICRTTRPDTWTIDTWLMSCRVLGRRVEQAVLARRASSASVGHNNIGGRLRSTDRNEMVRDHYAKLGFERIDDDTDGSSRWALRTDTELEEQPMTVQRGEPHLEPA